MFSTRLLTSCSSLRTEPEAPPRASCVLFPLIMACSALTAAAVRVMRPAVFAMCPCIMACALGYPPLFMLRKALPPRATDASGVFERGVEDFNLPPRGVLGVDAARGLLLLVPVACMLFGRASTNCVGGHAPDVGAAMPANGAVALCAGVAVGIGAVMFPGDARRNGDTARRWSSSPPAAATRCSTAS